MRKTFARIIGVLILPVTLVAEPIHWWNGYLSKTFEYGRELYRVELDNKDRGSISWQCPDDSFITNSFNTIYQGNIEQLTSKTGEEIKTSWRIYHKASYEEHAKCDVSFYSKKNDLKAVEWKVEDLKNKIATIDKCLRKAQPFTYLWNTDNITNNIKQKHRMNKEAFKKERKALISLQDEMTMHSFWSTHIFKNKPSNKELILQYAQNYQNATGKEVIQYKGHKAVGNLNNEDQEQEKKEPEQNENDNNYIQPAASLLTGLGSLTIAPLKK